MGDLGWPNFPPPSLHWLGATAMPKQVQIAAIDERYTGFDEGDHGVTQRRRLPRFGIDPSCAVDCYRDLAIGRAAHATVGGAEPQPKAAALIGGHACVAQGRTVEPGARQPRERIDAVEEFVIERNDRRELIVWRCAGQKKNREGRLQKS